ncbi:LytR C-terminal domain-containing protein [Varibaculum prostatecancerukia]|uniref:LytR C-terminal domain-containing protein n=1 Tax=Varibaculum prostatecancerukia TaxID=2811781 RepID=UPI001C005BEA|nr:LytR C-terminal domain-containing protein [Varibaculum prostatecancerukia]
MNQTQVSPGGEKDLYQSEMAASSDTTDPLANLSPYQRYVRRRQQRETMVFTIIGSVMAGLLVLSILVGFGILPFPFFNDFKQAPQYAQAGDVPCPTSEKAVPLDKMEVHVVNGTDVSGLAGKVAAGLKERGIPVKDIGNITTGSYEGNVQIITGPTGVNVAYTLARAFEDAEIVLDPRPTSDVTVTIGSRYSDMVTPEKFKGIAQKNLEEIDGCKLVQIA